MTNTRNQDPLHGITLKDLMTELVEHYGWEDLGKKIHINCFSKDPCLKSSLKFLRKTPWARAKVEQLYLLYLTEKPAPTVSAPSPYQPKTKNMPLKNFITRITANEQVSFDETIAIINEFYHYTPTQFTNGLGEATAINEAGTNEGSCKIFAFATLNQFTPAQTLNLFGIYYHNDVLKDPDGTGHQNIRNFMQSGWEGIKFSSDNALLLK